MGKQTSLEKEGHRSGDHLISSLLRAEGKVGDFLKVYPGSQIASGDDSWILDWFGGRIDYFMGNVDAKPEDLSLCDDFSTDALHVEEEIVTVPSRLLSVQPNYFRGFRKLDGPIDLSPNLVILEGNNSSGKTSLTEALEWLFSGELVRRKMQSQGDPKELENCITNQLIPDGEDCWVSAHLERENGTQIELKRVLVSDYGATSTSVPKSKVFLDGKELSEDEESCLLSDLFAGVPPLLMQHSLRSFVLSTSSQRRGYFENLLSLDELTYLIEKAVIGRSEAASFVSANGNKPLSEYRELATYHFPKDRTERQRDSIIQCKASLNPIPADTKKTLVPPISTVDEIAKTLFHHATAKSNEPYVDYHRSQRQAREPIKVL